MTEAAVNAQHVPTKQSLRSASYGRSVAGEIRFFAVMAREFADTPYVRRRRRDVSVLRGQALFDVHNRSAKRYRLLARDSRGLTLLRVKDGADRKLRLPPAAFEDPSTRSGSDSEASAAWLKLLGPFYSTAAVREILGRDGAPLSADAVRKRRGLLALRTGSGQTVYPAFQFKGQTSAPAMDRVLEALPESLISRWSVASWLVTPEPELDDERPIDLLHEGGPEAAMAVVRAAARWAGQLGATD